MLFHVACVSDHLPEISLYAKMLSFSAAMCPSDLQQLWKEVSGVQSSEEALKQAEGLDLSTNSSNSTSAFPKAASAHIPLHSLPNGQNHTPKRDRYSELLKAIKTAAFLNKHIMIVRLSYALLLLSVSSSNSLTLLFWGF